MFFKQYANAKASELLNTVDHAIPIKFTDTLSNIKPFPITGELLSLFSISASVRLASVVFLYTSRAM